MSTSLVKVGVGCGHASLTGVRVCIGVGCGDGSRTGVRVGVICGDGSLTGVKVGVGAVGRSGCMSAN